MKKLLILGLIGFSLSLAAEKIPIQTYVNDDGLMTIWYTLQPKDPRNTLPVFKITFTGEAAGKPLFTLRKITGSGATGLVLGSGDQISYWDATKDRPKDDPEHVNVTLYAEDVSEEAQYICLDLKKYKMSHQKTPPDILKNKCRTSELWLKRIEPGYFLMGSSAGEFGRKNNEDQHHVKINQAYYISIFETTQKQFKAICGQNPSTNRGATRPVSDVSYEMLRGDYYGSNFPLDHDVDCEWLAGYKTKWFVEIDEGYVDRWSEEVPVYKPTFFWKLRSKIFGVSIVDEELIIDSKFIVDLPTEAQWEYACRAGESGSLNDGKSLTDEIIDANLSNLGWYRYNSFDKKKKNKSVHPVGEKTPNAWGLYDMHGNVAEWCLDNYGEHLGAIAELNPSGPSFGNLRVLRGGNYYDDAADCRIASRQGKEPNSEITQDDKGKYFYDFEKDNYGNGFRIVVSLPPKEQFENVFEYTLPDSESDFPVFQVVFYAKTKDGSKYLLEDIGWLSGDGATGIVIGSGLHRITWESYGLLTNNLNNFELIVDVKDVTEQSEYLVLDLDSYKMRAETTGPNLSEDKCRMNELWLRRIEPGTFIMGSPQNELGRSSNEIQHQVTLTKPFYIGVFEITQAQYELIYGDNPSYYKEPLCPVESISYSSIINSSDSSFLNILRNKTGKGLSFTLPTEAQWEYACRAGTQTALNNGTNLTDINNCYNLNKLACYRNYYSRDYCEKVGSFLPNAWGLYDMHGNVWEWCSDFLDSYPSDPVTDPFGVSGRRVLRGGGWDSYAYECRSAFRGDQANTSYRYIGFRIVLIP